MKPKEFTKKNIQNTFVLQHDQSDCGVACLLSIIQLYKGSNTLEKLREASGTNQQGTTLLGLHQAANALGFHAEGCQADIQALIAHKQPVILHVVIAEKLQHYIVCYGYENDTFIIGDPAKGICQYTTAQLTEIWKSKTCLTLTPNDDFVKATAKARSKKQWFWQVLTPDVRLLKFSIVLGLCIAVLSMSMAVFSQKLIDDILPSKNMKTLMLSMVLITILLLVKALFSSLRDYFLIRQSKDFNNRIIDRFYSALLHLPKPFFDTRKIGELVARLNDTQRVQNVIKTIVGNTVINALVAIVSLGFLYYYSWQIAVIASMSLPFYFFLLYGFNTKIMKAQKEVMQGYALNESNYINTMQGIATIKNNNRQAIFQQINQLVYGNFQQKVFLLGKINVRLSLISGMFSVLFLMGILVFAATKVYQQQMLIGELTAILGVASSLLPAVASLALIAIPINEATVAFNRMHEFAALEKEAQGTSALANFESLVITNLSFRFVGRKQVLSNINITLQKQQCIAIVGESGCGKSTLGQLIQKFYSHESGSITINDNIPLKEVRTEDWRTIIGVIPQEITIFSGHVLDNIVLGQEAVFEEIHQFIVEYGFEDFIQSLPQGYATILGEQGINLSGGQKQVLALIRVLYKRPKVLILDEFTAAMDRNTERFVLQLLKKLKSKLSIIFISHRLHSLKQLADCIYVIENGTTTIHGTHKELLQSKNFYSDFWTDILKDSTLIPQIL